MGASLNTKRRWFQYSLRTILIVTMVCAGMFAWWWHPAPWTAKINDGLPLYWEKGTVSLLAWEVIEDNLPSKHTHAIVLKKFDQPTQDGAHRWLLARMYYNPKDAKRPWIVPFRTMPLFVPGKNMPKMTDAQLYGYEFYPEMPTDEQVEVFLNESGWSSALSEGFAFSDDLKTTRTITPKVTSGNVDHALWKSIFGRDVPKGLFRELK
ncbi:MAG: hypothetical protein K8T25_04410 [Planctomycetia bacterium]|nr:hypothetical protein [Planctomycetia bacterium]